MDQPKKKRGGHPLDSESPCMARIKPMIAGVAKDKLIARDVISPGLKKDFAHSPASYANRKSSNASRNPERAPKHKGRKAAWDASNNAAAALGAISNHQKLQNAIDDSPASTPSLSSQQTPIVNDASFTEPPTPGLYDDQGFSPNTYPSHPAQGKKHKHASSVVTAEPRSKKSRRAQTPSWPFLTSWTTTTSSLAILT